jgi:hypothetical protein
VIAVNQKVTLINAPCVSNPQVAQTAILWPCGLQEQKKARFVAGHSHPKIDRTVEIWTYDELCDA